MRAVMVITTVTAACNEGLAAVWPCAEHCVCDQHFSRIRRMPLTWLYEAGASSHRWEDWGSVRNSSSASGGMQSPGRSDPCLGELRVQCRQGGKGAWWRVIHWVASTNIKTPIANMKTIGGTYLIHHWPCLPLCVRRSWAHSPRREF